MPKVCCFLCPEANYSERSLDQACPSCGRPFGFPVTEIPERVREFRVLKALGRGFYSAIYLAVFGPLDTRVVLKVSSQKVYRYFGKSFPDECRKHKEVADNSDYLVPITTMFDEDIAFGDVVIPSHVAVLAYVDGKPLTDFLEGKEAISVRGVAQVAVDLFRILGDLERQRVNHNDLHGGNVLVVRLPRGQMRRDAIDETVRTIAVDLGSLSDASKSDQEQQRLGDLHWVAQHLERLVIRLIGNPGTTTDLDYRLASALHDLAHLFSPKAEHQRTPTFDECEERVKGAVSEVQSPWREPFRLRKFNDAYNAQTLAPWFVPHLLVDPGDTWVKRLSSRGPQVITGMRGCGKTLLLRALQLHARASTQSDETPEQILQRLTNDGFVGIYVSSTKLLDVVGAVDEELFKPYERLFVAYAVEALRAVRHLGDLSGRTQLVVPGYYARIGGAVADHLSEAQGLRDATSEEDLEQRLLQILVALSQRRGDWRLDAHPVSTFAALAEAIRQSSPIWAHSYVLFLLDDVSTRHLKGKQIADLLSALLFSSQACAFKLSTETQTIELVLRSPGLIERAQAGRDYDVFDLGAEVNARLRLRGERSAFLEEILQRRGAHYRDHPTLRPSQIVGDETLEAIAAKIASLSETSGEKKEIYHGITALGATCVGDIGDVISIYELMLQSHKGQYPIPKRVQSECYQDFCSRRLYSVNRRSSRLKDFALSFAEASHELLMRSGTSGVKGERPRLRQYLKLYVRITKGDLGWQFLKLRDLIDAGLFVIAGGADTPRTKTKDGDPIQQFVLTYRKLFGLSNFIGLAERDRFELSGDDLVDWLNNPAKGKEILLRNLGGAEDEEDDEPPPPAVPPVAPVDVPSLGGSTTTVKADQMHLDFVPAPGPSEGSTGRSGASDLTTLPPTLAALRCTTVRPPDMRNLRLDHAVVGLGFEDRALASARRLMELTRPRTVTLVRYREVGKAREIDDVVRSAGADVKILEYPSVALDAWLGDLDGNVIVDVSGLAKPVLFEATTKSLRRNGRVWVCHTAAEVYYPLQAEVETVLKADRDRNHYKLLEALSNLLTGEEAPFGVVKLIESDADETRRRVLCAFAAAKHQRLLTLLDQRDFDRVEVVIPGGSTPRGQVARIAGEVAVGNVKSGRLTEISSNDVASVLDYIAAQYREWYVNRGFNFEVGLTGSKLQAVACAVINACVKLSQCWYVRPSQFHVARFTSGVGASTYWSFGVKD